MKKKFFVIMFIAGLVAYASYGSASTSYASSMQKSASRLATVDSF